MVTLQLNHNMLGLKTKGLYISYTPIFSYIRAIEILYVVCLWLFEVFKMKCPYCGFSETRVLDSRESEDSDVTRRRRECEKCSKRFTTYERVEMLDLRIIKKDGRIESFDRNKVLRGVLKACEKRPIKIEKIEKLVDEIESELRKNETTEIQSKAIGEMVMEKLKELDKVAYVRFASVYKEFTDLKSFETELKKIKK